MTEFLGVIEGFYGQAWSYENRCGLPRYLNKLGLNTYVYAPKSDRYLRNNWAEPFAAESLAQLKAVAKACQQESVLFGVGLSPLGAAENLTEAAANCLVHKLTALAGAGVKFLCLLFDDIPADSETLAANQIRLCELVEENWHGELAMCPSYYSFDSALETHFGSRPENYWPTIASQLSGRWNVFWTGEQVISQTYPAESLRRATTVLGREPIIWDNSPVNDGRLTWPFMNLAVNKRSLASELTSGVLHNPMNQAWCSRFTLGRIYSSDSALPDLLDAPKPLIENLLADAEGFQAIGLDGFTEVELADLKTRYQKYQHPLAVEVLAWLDRQYRFDPNCLT